MLVHGVLCVLLLVSVGPAWGRIIVEVPNNDLETNTCPHEAIPNTRFTVPFILLNLQHECYKPTPVFLSQLNFASTTAEYRRIFQKACVQSPQVKTCIEGVARDSDVCLSSLERKMFKTVRDFIDLSIDTTCADGSDTIAKIYGDELKNMDFASQIRVLSCMSAMATKMQYKSGIDVPEYTLDRYKAMQQGKQCMINVAQSKRRPFGEFEKYAGHLLERMECVHPTTHEVVACHSLEQKENIRDSLEATIDLTK